jgi:ABC-2 type transport system ATP-binding protein
VPQLPALHEDDRCEDALAFIAELRRAGRADVDRALETVHLTEERALRVGELSGGMRQRLAMGAALLGQPDLLLLDEPMASLDAESRVEFERVLRALRDEGRTVLLSTHFLDRVEGLVSRALILRDGALAYDGTLRDLLERVHGRRYIVHIDGNAPASFMRAMSDLGVPPEDVALAPLSWDDIVAAVGPLPGEKP